jgi:hypothetical protein
VAPTNTEPVPTPPPTPPPRAFSQGVGTLFQTAGVLMFLAFMFVCCGSALTSREWATRPGREQVGWKSPAGRVVYSEKDWTTATVVGGVLLGFALAGIGLGLQADKRPAALAGAGVTLIAAAFWAAQTAFAIGAMRSVLMGGSCFVLLLICGVLFGFAVGAVRELTKHPANLGQELLPADFREPFSHLHEDSPEARLADEIAQRRRRLEVEQKELEALERRLRRKMEDKH